MQRQRTRPVVSILAAAAMVLGMSVAGPVRTASAAADFYSVPGSLAAGAHGTLIKQEIFQANLGSGAPFFISWRMMYRTTDSLGAPAVATGTVLTPLAPWLGGGSRPVVNYAPASQGLGPQCAPSKQIAAGTEYETANLTAILKKGYAVVMTDYQGYTTGGTPLYLVGSAAARNVLDASAAASRIPFAGIDGRARTVVWGFSQGGQASNWAGKIQPAYAPELNLIGIASGGSVSDLLPAAKALNGGIGTGDVAMAIMGLDAQYPAIGLSSLVNDAGARTVAALRTQCVFDSILEYQGLDIKDFTKNGQTLDQLASTPVISAAIEAQRVRGSRLAVPVYQYHGQADEFVPLAQAVALKKEYCAAGTPTQFGLYPSEHIATQFQAATNVLSWVSDRVAGKKAPSTCATTAPEPVSTANPASDGFKVSSVAWPLSGALTVKALGAPLSLPKGANFSGTTNLTTKLLENGEISVPTFTTSVNAYGVVPLELTTGITQQGPATGTASLGSDGILHIRASSTVAIQLKSVKALGLSVTDPGCQTVSPVTLPLAFDGPVSALGSGGLVLSGDATFPRLTGCGALNDLLNGLFPGPGNTFAFTLQPPAPVNW